MRNTLFSPTVRANILYDGPAPRYPIDQLHLLCDALNSKGLGFSMGQNGPDHGVVLGPEQIEVRVSCHNEPVPMETLGPPLASTFNYLPFPDAEDCAHRHTSVVQIEVEQGVFACLTDNPEISGFLDQIGMTPPGHSVEEFQFRCIVLALLCDLFVKAGPALAIYWAPSARFIPAKFASELPSMCFPSPLTIHPWLTGQVGEQAQGNTAVGFSTIGATCYLGREIIMRPAPVPWMDLYEAALSLIKFAIRPNGYVPPDQDAFADETKLSSYRVLHLEAGNDEMPTGEPCYVLELLYDHRYGYRKPGDTTPQSVPLATAAAWFDPTTPGGAAELARMTAVDDRGRAAGIEIGFRPKSSSRDPFSPPPRPKGPTSPIIPFGRKRS